MSAVYPVNLFPPVQPHGVCPDCGFIRSRMLANLTFRESMRFNERIEHRSLIKRKDYLHHAGSAFKSIYLINRGFLKTAVTDGHGREQTIGFPTAGDLIGLEAIGAGRYNCNTVALEDSRVCGMRYSHFEELARDIPALQQHFHRLIGQEISRNLRMTHLLRGLGAEDRVATFLLNLSRRFAARGSSGTRFRMPMSRRDIASFLGLKLETVSRALSHFGNLQIIAIKSKDIEIANLARLRQLIGNRDNRRFALQRAASMPNAERTLTPA